MGNCTQIDTEENDCVIFPPENIHTSLDMLIPISKDNCPLVEITVNDNIYYIRTTKSYERLKWSLDSYLSKNAHFFQGDYEISNPAFFSQHMPKKIQLAVNVQEGIMVKTIYFKLV